MPGQHVQDGTARSAVAGHVDGDRAPLVAQRVREHCPQRIWGSASHEDRQRAVHRFEGDDSALIAKASQHRTVLTTIRSHIENHVDATAEQQLDDAVFEGTLRESVHIDPESLRSPAGLV
jgi:hypothetical protein